MASSKDYPKHYLKSKMSNADIIELATKKTFHISFQK